MGGGGGGASLNSPLKGEGDRPKGGGGVVLQPTVPPLHHPSVIANAMPPPLLGEDQSVVGRNSPRPPLEEKQPFAPPPVGGGRVGIHRANWRGHAPSLNTSADGWVQGRSFDAITQRHIARLVSKAI